MAVSIDTTATQINSSSLLITIGNNSNRVVVATGESSFSFPTLGGIAASGSYYNIYWWINPAVGANTLNGGPVFGQWGAISFYNANAVTVGGENLATSSTVSFSATAPYDNSYAVGTIAWPLGYNFTGSWSFSILTIYSNSTYEVGAAVYQNIGTGGTIASMTSAINSSAAWTFFVVYVTQYALPTVTTQAISTQDAQGFPVIGNGTITYDGGTGDVLERGIVYGTTSVGSTPGNVAPASSGYAEVVQETVGNYAVAAFTERIFDMLNGAVIIDSYALANQNNEFPVYATLSSVGQTISVSKTSVINTASFIAKIVGTVTGNVTASIYAITGSFGSTAVPTGSALATSDNINITSISTSYQTVTFTFSGANKITLTSGTNYALVVNYSGGSAGNVLELGVNTSAPTADGNFVFYSSGSWFTGGNSIAITYVLNGAITYYARAYTRNSQGYAYGAEVSFAPNYQIAFLGSD